MGLQSAEIREAREVGMMSVRLIQKDNEERDVTFEKPTAKSTEYQRVF